MGAGIAWKFELVFHCLIFSLKKKLIIFCLIFFNSTSTLDILKYLTLRNKRV